MIKKVCLCSNKSLITNHNYSSTKSSHNEAFKNSCSTRKLLCLFTYGWEVSLTMQEELSSSYSTLVSLVTHPAEPGKPQLEVDILAVVFIR